MGRKKVSGGGLRGKVSLAGDDGRPFMKNLGKLGFHLPPQHLPPWRNRLARSAVNRKVGGSSPPGGEEHLLFQPLETCWTW